MKKLFLLFIMLTGMLAYSQTTVDLSGLTEDVQLGQNCSSSQTPEEYVTTGDLNLNGFELTLRNATLTVNGNINGDGEIDGCGQSSICYTGAIQNDVELDDIEAVNCSTLSNPTHNMELVYSYNRLSKDLLVTDATTITIYDLMGRRLMVADSNTVNLSGLKVTYLIVKPELANVKDTKAFKLLR